MSKLFQFHAVFWGYLAKSYVRAPSTGRLAPPPRGNPGSATEGVNNHFGGSISPPINLTLQGFNLTLVN